MRIPKTVWTEERSAKGKELVERGLTYDEIAGYLGVTAGAVATHARRQGWKPKGKKQKRWNLPKQADIPRAITNLEKAVDKLRMICWPVCAEDTIRRPHVTPKPYSDKTLFRVGKRSGVTAKEILKMAGPV